MRALTAIGELCGGGLCVAGAALVVRLAPVPPAAVPAPPAPAPARTPAPEAPPPSLGPAFDSDAALPRHAPGVASYTLTARLDATAHEVRGSGTIEWVNTSRVAAREIWLHLYLNAFKNERTLFLRSPFGAGRSGDRATAWGYVDVERLVARELGNRDLWPDAARHSEGDPDDQTDIRVPLPKPIEPGETLTLEVAFTSKLPAIVERTGYSGSFHFVGQWFPKLARREPDGTWVHFPFHPQSEFYADYGRYDVTLDVPIEMRVGATGRRVDERQDGGRRVVRHVAEDVHDFAWTAWDGFREQRQTIDGIEIVLLHPAGHDANVATTLEALRSALPRFNRLYGRYPHPILTVVHPPAHAPNAGGMEYPMLITTGGPWYAARSGVRAIEAVTVHELGHQWFQGLIGTNEHAWPFLDEGLTTYVESTALSAAHGPGSLVDWPGLSVSDDAARRALSASYGHDDVVARPAAGFASFRHVGALVYARTSTLLGTVGAVYGEAALQRALGRYARRYRFRHPTPKHFLAAVRETLGEEAARNLEAGLFERAWVDYAAESLRSAPVASPAGVFDRESGRETVTRESAASQEWDSRLLVVRRGSLRFPVDVELVLENGERVRKRWDGHGPWIGISHRSSSRVVAAVVDPDRRILIDDDLTNNATGGGMAAPRVWERATYLAQLALGGPLP